jgi:hypothetical protein
MPTFTAERAPSTTHAPPTSTPSPAPSLPADAEVQVVHQPRERSVQCSGCGAKDQWDAQHGYCGRCIDRGHLTTRCRCAEGIRATQVAARLGGATTQAVTA